MAYKSIKKKLNYFHFAPVYFEHLNLPELLSAFKDLKSLSESQKKERFYESGRKVLFFNDLRFIKDKHEIHGRLLDIRMDEIPELINITNNEIAQIQAKDEQGVIETTHFILNHSQPNNLILSLESNHYGPKIGDFIKSIKHYFFKAPLKNLYCNPYIKDDLRNYRNRIRAVTEVHALVHKNNVERVKDYDNDLLGVLNAAQSFNDSDTIQISFRMDARKGHSSNRMTDKVHKIIDKMLKGARAAEVFDQLSVKARDEMQNNRISDFDLLNILIKSEISVSCKERSRVVNTNEMFLKMTDALKDQFE